jgi:hypothetical protein
MLPARLILGGHSLGMFYYESWLRSVSMESEDLRKDVEQLKIAQATQAATTAGAQATLAATQAGATSTLAATQAGLMSTIVVGSVSLIIGIFLGLTIVKSKT